MSTTFERGHCPTCGSNRADEILNHKVDVFIEEADIHGSDEYKIIECRGCGCIYFKHSHSDSDDVEHYPSEDGQGWDSHYPVRDKFWPPASSRREPDWFGDLLFENRQVHSLCGDVYTALSADLGVFAAIGIRTVFDAASEHLGIDPAKTFQEKLSEMKAGGNISEKEEKILEALIDAGSAAAHRGWRPKASELATMMDILEGFLHRVFILPEKADELREKVPARQRRR